MIVNVALCANVTPVTVITWPLTPTVPVLAVVHPAAAFEIEGADQFAGTVNSTAPAFVPPATVSVYVNVSVNPDEPAICEVGAIDAVPEPSAEAATTIAEDGADVVRLSPLVLDAVKWIVSPPREVWTELRVTVHVPAVIVPVLPLSVPAPSDAREIPVLELTAMQFPPASWLCTVTEKFTPAVAFDGTEVTTSFVATSAVRTTSFPVPPV